MGRTQQGRFLHNCHIPFRFLHNCHIPFRFLHNCHIPFRFLHNCHIPFIETKRISSNGLNKIDKKLSGTLKKNKQTATPHNGTTNTFCSDAKGQHRTQPTTLLHNLQHCYTTCNTVAQLTTLLQNFQHCYKTYNTVHTTWSWSKMAKTWQWHSR